MSDEFCEPDRHLIDPSLNFCVDQMKKYGVEFILMRLPDGVIREIPRAYIDPELLPKPTSHRKVKVYISPIDGVGYPCPWNEFQKIEKEKRLKLAELEKP